MALRIVTGLDAGGALPAQIAQKSGGVAHVDCQTGT
jgi:hypothetical protein